MEAKRPRRRPADERREQILDAAERVLLQRGLTATTVADVAEGADVAKGTVYLYFDSKDALIAGLRSRYLQRFAEAIGASTAASAASPQRRLDRFISGLFEFSSENHRLHHLLFHQAGFSEEDAFAGARAMLAEVVADGIASGAFRVRDASAASSFVVHGLHGMLVDALHEPGRLRTSVAAAKVLAAGALGREWSREKA